MRPMARGISGGLAALAIGITLRAQAPPTVPAGVDCWIPRVDQGRRDARLEPIRNALQTFEHAIKANEAFTGLMPEPVRMQVWTNLGDGPMWLEVAAYPRQFGATPYWTATGCDIVRTSRNTASYEHPLGLIHVGVNRSGLWEASYFNQSKLKPVRVVSGFPVFEYRWSALATRLELLVITKDGRLPIVPVTLADRLDREAAFLAKRVDEVRTQLAARPPPSVDAVLRPQDAELRRQIEALGAYRASFSADDLRAAWVQHDPQGRDAQELEARVRALSALSPEDQAQVNELGAQARALQRQALTRGTPPEEAARLRDDANMRLQQARAITMAQQGRVAARVTAERNDFAMRLMRPGAAAEASDFKDDPTFWDPSDPGRIQLITVDFSSGDSRATTVAQAAAWMDRVEASFDYAALKAVIR